MASRKGKIFILIGPPSVGKNTLMERVREEVNELGRIISATTRDKRVNEVHGKDKFFLTEKEFNQAIKNNEFIEWQKLHGNKYGVLKKTVKDSLATGKDFIMDIEVLGATKFKEIFGESVVMIFILPPSFKELKKRIQKRGVDDEKGIMVRLSRSKAEAAYLLKCDCVLINDDLEEAVRGLIKITRREREDIYYSKSRIIANSTAIIFNKDASKILIQKNGRFLREGVERGKFPHEKLIEEIKLLSDNKFNFIQDDELMKENNEGLDMFLPFWISIDRSSNKLKIEFYYSVRFTKEIKRDGWGWIVKRDFFSDFSKFICDNKIKNELKRIL